MGQCFDMMQFKELTYDSCKDVVEGDANDGESLTERRRECCGCLCRHGLRKAL